MSSQLQIKYESLKGGGGMGGTGMATLFKFKFGAQSIIRFARRQAQAGDNVKAAQLCNV